MDKKIPESIIYTLFSPYTKIKNPFRILVTFKKLKA